MIERANRATTRGVLPVAVALLSCALVTSAIGMPATATTAPDQSSVASTKVVPSVAVLLEGDHARIGGWNSVPVTAHLVPSVPGRVLYRFEPGPGQWLEADGPIPVPEGKQSLVAVVEAEDGTVSEETRVTVRSAFRTPANLLAVAPQVAPSSMDTAALSRGGAVRVAVSVRPQGAVTLTRRDGADRYAVGASVSRSTFTSADTVIIASGEKFPDALTASGLAGAMGAPLLLARPAGVPASVKAEIRRLGARKAIICGGRVTLDGLVEKDLRGLGLTFERIAGADRYEVAANVAARIRTIKGAGGRALMARGDLYPDALSLGPIAYQRREPVLLVLPNKMPAATRKALGAGYTSVAIAGGPASVSSAVEKEARSIVGSTVRWGGRDRYEAAVTIAAAGVAGGSNGWGYIGIAKGTDFPDALTGGVGTGKHAGVLLLTAPEPLTTVTRRAMEARVSSIKEVDVFGGPKSVAPATFEEIRAVLM